MIVKVCSVEDCERDAMATKPHCTKHHRRVLRFGTPTGYKVTRSTPPVDGLCALDGCDEAHEAKGYCANHYRRWKRWGDPYAGRKSTNPGETCSIEGCNREAQKREMCSKHYQRWRKKGDPNYQRPIKERKGRGPCHIEDCHRPHKGHGLCETHLWRYKQWGDPFWAGERERPAECSAEDCTRDVVELGYCNLHAQRQRNFGDANRTRPATPETCTIEDCDRPHQARGMCGAHYTRWQVWGDANVVRKIPKYEDGVTCLVDDCPRRPMGAGYCGLHYQRIQIHGDPEHSRTTTYERDQPSYVYVISYEPFDALKVGIGAVVKRGGRLNEWKRHGWQVIRRLPGDGVQAAVGELAGLHYLRHDLQLPVWLSADTMPGRGKAGWTETAQLSEVNIPHLVRVIREAMLDVKIENEEQCA